MNKEDNNSKDFYVIDIQHIFKSLWKRLWAIVLAGIITASAGFCLASFVIAPKYRATIMLYVNNADISVGGSSFSISSSEITAAQSLVKTYSIILDNRTTLETVINKNNLDYDYHQLSEMVHAYAVKDTEVMAVEVTSESRQEAVEIANSIGDVLVDRIAQIMDGSNVKIIDTADPKPPRVSPNVTNYTAAGFALGVIVATIVVIIMALMDDTIHDEEYLIKSYEYPILAKVPDLFEHTASKDYYYRSSKKEGNR